MASQKQTFRRGWGRASWCAGLTLCLVVAAGPACVSVSHHQADGGVIGTNSDATIEAGSVFTRPDAPSVDFGSAADLVLERVVGSAPLGDAACAAHTQKAEQLPLDIYIMFDASASMTDMTSTGQTKWDAVRMAL